MAQPIKPVKATAVRKSLAVRKDETKTVASAKVLAQTPAEPTAKPREIPERVVILENTVLELNARVRELILALTPVLPTGYQVTVTDAEILAIQSQTPLGTSLASIAVDVSSVNNMLSSVLDHIEI